MDDSERANRLVALLINYRAKLEMEEGRRIKDNEFAVDYLQVKPASFNQWFNRTRMPKDFENILKLSRVLGDEVFDILDYPRGEFITEDKLRYIAKVWRIADETDKERIYQLIEEELGRIEKKKHRRRSEVLN